MLLCLNYSTLIKCCNCMASGNCTFQNNLYNINSQHMHLFYMYICLFGVNMLTLYVYSRLKLTIKHNLKLVYSLVSGSVLLFSSLFLGVQFLLHFTCMFDFNFFERIETVFKEQMTHIHIVSLLIAYIQTTIFIYR